MKIVATPEEIIKIIEQNLLFDGEYIRKTSIRQAIHSLPTLRDELIKWSDHINALPSMGPIETIENVDSYLATQA